MAFGDAIRRAIGRIPDDEEEEQDPEQAAAEAAMQAESLEGRAGAGDPTAAPPEAVEGSINPEDTEIKAQEASMGDAVDPTSSIGAALAAAKREAEGLAEDSTPVEGVVPDAAAASGGDAVGGELEGAPETEFIPAASEDSGEGEFLGKEPGASSPNWDYRPGPQGAGWYNTDEAEDGGFGGPEEDPRKAALLRALARSR